MHVLKPEKIKKPFSKHKFTGMMKRGMKLNSFRWSATSFAIWKNNNIEFDAWKSNNIHMILWDETGHYLNQIWLVYWRIYTLLGLDELIFACSKGSGCDYIFGLNIHKLNDSALAFLQKIECVYSPCVTFTDADWR